MISSMGGNDTGNFDDKTMNKLAQKVLVQNIPRHLLNQAQKELLAFDPIAEKHKAFDDIKTHIDEVFGRLQEYFSNARITYVGIWPREDWLPESITSSRDNNTYIAENKAHKVVYLDWLLEPMHIKSDLVHLTNAGYRLFIDQIYHSAISSYLMPAMREAKRKHRQF